MLKKSGEKYVVYFSREKKIQKPQQQKTSNICFLFEKDLASSFLMAY